MTKKSDFTPELLAKLVSSNSVDETEAKDLANILIKLPRLQKRAIELRYIHEWSFEKIAADLKTSEENTRQIISRGVKKLRNTIANQSARK